MTRSNFYAAGLVIFLLAIGVSTYYTIAILPSAPVVFVGGLIVYFWHKGVTDRLHARIDELAASHAEHAEHMKRVLDILDPETDGGIADVHAALALIKDDLNPETPSGVGVLDEKVNRLLRHLKVAAPPGEPGRAVE